MRKVLLINALIWATVILLFSYWFKGTENYQYLFGTLLVAAGLQNTVSYDYFKKQSKK